jgi:alpha-tubulin suppressor-like RCC1 family protein
MPSNFDSNATDLEDIFAPRSWFKLGPALFAWGTGGPYSYGALGLNDTIFRSSPTQVGRLTNWQHVSGAVSNGTSAIKTDGTLWTWGYNGSFGALGLNSTVATSSPVQIGTGLDWKTSSSSYSMFAIKAGGTLWCWGRPTHGTLGLNNTIARSSPTQVGTSSDWLSVSAGRYHALATKINGTLWSWGSDGGGGNSGLLGLNDTILRSSPTQIGTSTGWTGTVLSAGQNASFIVRNDGTMWSFGASYFGQLGLNDNFNRSSPTQIGTLTNWRNVSFWSNSALATKTDGTLWSWGYGTYGGLGLNSTISRSSPVQIGTLSNWRSVASSFRIAFSIKTDGTLWGWGANSNNYGKLGLSDSINRSSPVQIGTLTNWKSVSFRNAAVFATLNFTTI